MLKTAFLTVLFLMACFESVSARENDEKKISEWHLRDLYYYDHEGVQTKLELAPKIFVRFIQDLSKQERAAFLAGFSLIVEKYMGHSEALAAFNGPANTLVLIDTINKILRTEAAHAYPVFLIDNIEAVLEGIAVEAKAIISPQRILDRMKKYGEFSIRQTKTEGREWVFLIDDVAPPLNLLVLANLVHNDAWVRRAYPRFRFLHDPIVASIFVEPISGTIGEVRTVTLAVRVFDPNIALSDDQLPNFNEGLFKPVRGHPANPASIVHPPGYLFYVIEGPIRHQPRLEGQSRTYAVSWRFKFHALGEWTIHPQPISYTKKGVSREARSSQASMVVRSQIGEQKIDDVPVPPALSFPPETPVAVAQPELPPIPVWWFDRYENIIKPARVARYTGIAALVLTAATLVMFGLFIHTKIKQARERSRGEHEVFQKLANAMQKARSAGSYKLYEEILAETLSLSFPHLSSYPTWEEIKDDEKIVAVLGREKLNLLEKTFYELNRRHRKGFTPSSDDLRELDENVSLFYGEFTHLYAMRSR